MYETPVMYITLQSEKKNKNTDSATACTEKTKNKGQNQSWEIWQGFKRSQCTPSLGNHIATVISMTTAGPRLSALGERNSGRALNHTLLFSILDNTGNGLDFLFMVTFMHL